MPSVTINAEDLEKEGPVIEIHFLIPAELEKKYNEEKKQVPPPVILKALIDTGATACVIQDEIPKKLGLNPIGDTKICTPSSKDNRCYVYYMRMVSPLHNLAYEGPFIAAPLEGQEVGCLIGRDALKSGIFIYIGYHNQFTLSIL